jgi:hypothetical protein
MGIKVQTQSSVCRFGLVWFLGLRMVEPGPRLVHIYPRVEKDRTEPQEIAKIGLSSLRSFCSLETGLNQLQLRVMKVFMYIYYFR